MNGPPPARMLITADLCARAVIAAARVFGDEPAAALIAAGNHASRRTVGAAASAICRVFALKVQDVPAAFGVKPATIYGSRSRKPDRFLEAEAAAMRAVEYARWRPDAAESVVASVAESPVATGGGGGEDRVIETIVGPLPAPMPTPSRAIAARSISPPPGRLGSVMAPPRPPPPAPVTTESALRDRILDVLGDGDACTQGLASILGAKELTVSTTLRAMEVEGLVEAAAIPPEGMRHRRWRRVRAAA